MDGVENIYDRTKTNSLLFLMKKITIILQEEVNKLGRKKKIL